HAPLTQALVHLVVGTVAPRASADARSHPLVCDNLAVSELGVAAYLGTPLATSDCHVLGSFCVNDSVPRAWSSHDAEVLRDLPAFVMTEIDLRSELAERRRAQEALRHEREGLERRVEERTAALAGANA